LRPYSQALETIMISRKNPKQLHIFLTYLRQEDSINTEAMSRHALGSTRSRCVVAESCRQFLDMCGTVGSRIVSQTSARNLVTVFGKFS
jgi:hypothetical protein